MHESVVVLYIQNDLNNIIPQRGRGLRGYTLDLGQNQLKNYFYMEVLEMGLKREQERTREKILFY